MTSPEKLATPEINHASAETAKVVEQAIGALADILGGWRYIRQSHGDLYGVGWDRCEKSASIAIAALRTEVSRLATGRGWLPIESAPLFTPLDGPIPPCLVYAPGYGVCMGAAGQDKFGHKYAYINSVSGSAGDIVTHFMFLPAAPGATSQGVAVPQPDYPPAIKNKGVAFRDWGTHPLYKSATAMGHFDAGWMRCLAATTSKEGEI